MEALLLIVAGAVNVVCFTVGAKVGQTVTKGERVTMPDINPIKAVLRHNQKVKADIERDKAETILHNIDCYDGTGRNQKEI